MNDNDYIGEDLDEADVREFKALSGSSARNYQEWLARQDEDTQAEERLFRSNGL